MHSKLEPDFIKNIDAYYNKNVTTIDLTYTVSLSMLWIQYEFYLRH